MWSKEQTTTNLEKIYATYRQLHQRQELVRPLLPLKNNLTGVVAEFEMEDYSSAIVDSKNALSEYVYSQAEKDLKLASRMQARQIYSTLLQLRNLNPNYRNLNQLIDQAQDIGTDYAYLNLKNETDKIIPKALENELLDFNTYGIKDNWTVYHGRRDPKVAYDFGIEVVFKNIEITPEVLREKEIVQEKQIKDGTKNLVDRNGNIVRDSLGKPIKIDNIKTVKATIYQTLQTKSALITAQVIYKDVYTNQNINTYPLTSQYVFEHYFATYKGDKRACDNVYLGYFNQKLVPFPSNEQMVYDTGEDLKNQLKNILSKYRLRN